MGGTTGQKLDEERLLRKETRKTINHGMFVTCVQTRFRLAIRDRTEHQGFLLTRDDCVTPDARARDVQNAMEDGLEWSSDPLPKPHYVPRFRGEGFRMRTVEPRSTVWGGGGGREGVGQIKKCGSPLLSPQTVECPRWRHPFFNLQHGFSCKSDSCEGLILVWG